MSLIASLFIFLAAASTSDNEDWNAGVDAYNNGDVTNALRVLEPLMMQRTNFKTTPLAARAAAVVAKIAYDAGNLEKAADAAQIALRANPDDPKANNNFTRAVDRLPEKREEARLQKILQAAQGQDPGAMVLGGMHEARALLAEAGTYRTNDAPRAVAAADRLGARAAKLADTWIPVRELICQSVTNEEQAATILAQVEAASKKTREAAEKLGDLDPEGYAAASEVEHNFNRFAKLTAMPPAAMDEDLVAQSNAWQDVETVNGRAWQPEALDWTRAFRARFPAWARAYDEQAKADTNKPPFTAEDQAKVSALATELEKLQISCVEKDLPPEQEKSIRIIEQIRALLPKDKNGGGGGQGQPQANKDQQKQDQKDQKQDQKDQQQDRQNQDQSQEKQDQDPNEQQQDEQKDAQDDEQEQPDDREVEDVLKKAQERSDEHEADKKARMRKAPLPPNERDW